MINKVMGNILGGLRRALDIWIWQARKSIHAIMQTYPLAGFIILTARLGMECHELHKKRSYGV